MFRLRANRTERVLKSHSKGLPLESIAGLAWRICKLERWLSIVTWRTVSKLSPRAYKVLVIEGFLSNTRVALNTLA
jgi:hypothetical protein